MKILILGGSRFFGKKLASKLISQGHDVTLLSRGKADDGFGDKVKRLKCDRTDASQLNAVLEGTVWDVVYDQICFDYQQAEQACEIFKGKTKRYIFTSSVSVYDLGKSLESAFDAKNYEIKQTVSTEENYGEAKRQAEVAFEKCAAFPVVSVRLPFVLGTDDYTQRLKWHVDRIKNKKPIYFPNLNAQVSLITSDFAASALLQLATADFTGPINVASPEPMSLKKMCELIELEVGTQLIPANRKKEDNHSPYGVEGDWYVNCRLANSLGLVGEPIEAWLPGLIHQLS